MKYVLVIGDGIADAPIEALGNVTPLGYAHCPNANVLAGGEIGMVRTVPKGIVPGSDTAILSIFGFDPRTCYTGRSALEAAGSGVHVAPGETSLRINLCALEGQDFAGARILSHNGGNIEGEEAETLMNDLMADSRYRVVAQALGLRIAVTRTFRHIGVMDSAHAAPKGETMRFTEPHNILGEGIAPYMPGGYAGEAWTTLMRTSFEVLRDHPINKARIARGELPANCLWPWGPGSAMALEAFEEKFHHTGTVISAVPLVWGIAALCSLKAPKVDGATGELDTNYEGKVEAALSALQGGDDFVAIHVEAPDECTHAGDLQGKVEAIRRIDARVLAPLLERLPGIDKDFRLLYLSDHPTLMATRGHDDAPVPFALYDSRTAKGQTKFDEVHAQASGVSLPCADRELMARLFGQEVN